MRVTDPTPPPRADVIEERLAPKPLRSAYLVLAHRAPRQVLRLIDRLDGPGAHVFVHASRNAEPGFFEHIQDAVAARTQVSLVERQVVRWGRAGLAKAVLAAIHQACIDNIRLDFLTILSGQDYPVRGRVHIESTLSEHVDYTLMEARKVPDEIWGAGGKERYSVRHVTLAGREIRYPPFTRREDWLGRSSRLLVRPRELPHGLQPYGGSSWISFTSDAVGFLNEFARTAKGRQVLRFFNSVLHPEEMLFQTILMNSELSNRVHTRNYRYIDWSVEPKHPKVLSMNDYEKLLTSGAFLARKFDEVESPAIMDALDAVGSAVQP